MGKRKDGLYLYENPKTGILYVRGAYLGKSFDESTRTRVRDHANGILKKREREVYAEVVLGKKPDRQFAEAAAGYMLTKLGEARALLHPILTARIDVDGAERIFGEMLLGEIVQGVVDRLAFKLYPADDATNSTRNRKIYTPVSAVLRWASKQNWGYQYGGMERPQQPKGRIDWRTPEEIEWWIREAGQAGPIITAYVGTGARASELINLDWLNVSPAGERIVLWDDETKAGKDRSVDLQARVRQVLPERGDGRVWRSSKGEPWHDYDAINLLLRRISEREAMRRGEAAEREQIAALTGLARSIKKTVTDAERAAARAGAKRMLDALIAKTRTPSIHLHILRHTWATWGYAATSDLAWLMQQGGWESEKIALRYIHVGTADLKAQVLGYGWEMRAGSLARTPAALGPSPALLPAPSRESA